MLEKIRKIINDNRAYAWMLVFIILFQAVVLISDAYKPKDRIDLTLSAEEFKQKIEARQEAFKQAVMADPQLAANFGILSFFVLGLFMTGVVFLTDSIIKKIRYNKDAIPETFRPPPPLWSGADVLKVVILTLFLSHLFLILAGILIAPFKKISLDRRLNLIITTGFIDMIIFIYIIVFVVKKYKQTIGALGLSLKGLSRNLGIAIYAYLGFLPILAAIFSAVLFAAKILNYAPPPQPIYELIFDEKRTSLLVIVSAMIAVAGPFIEEVFFRGFLYAALKKSLGIPSGIFISAFLFSLLHTNLLGFFPIFALGLFLAYLREKTGSLIPSITVHIVHNTALASIMFFIKELT